MQYNTTICISLGCYLIDDTIWIYYIIPNETVLTNTCGSAKICFDVGTAGINEIFFHLAIYCAAFSCGW